MKIVWNGENIEEVFEFVENCFSTYLEFVGKKDGSLKGVLHTGYQCSFEIEEAALRIQAKRADEVHSFLVPLGETILRSHKKDKEGSRTWIVVGMRPRLKKITRVASYLEKHSKK